MKPLRRSLFNSVAALSLVLWVGMLVFGVWGFREASDVRFQWVGKHRILCLLSDRGAMGLIHSDGWPDAAWAIDGVVQSGWTVTPLTINNLLLLDTTFERLAVSDGVVTGTVTYRGVRTNIVYGTVFTLVTPVAWCILKARRRERRGRCPVCGYDLRATPNRCPE